MLLNLFSPLILDELNFFVYGFWLENFEFQIKSLWII